MPEHGIRPPAASQQDTAAHDAVSQQDAAAREMALDRTRSFIVQAPAGSGKTELLIQRYLALLATVDAPEEIIAITFTRKAAAEMRVRILQALKNAGGADAETAHARRTQQLAREALRRDAAMGWSLPEQPGRLRLLTIDALNGWIARQMPWLSGMGMVANVADDSVVLYREAVREVLLGASGGTKVHTALRSLLVHLDNRFGIIEEMLVGMLGIRDQWIGLVTGNVDGLSARAAIEHTLQRLIAEHLQRIVAHAPPADLEELTGLAAHAAAVLDADPGRGEDRFRACLGRREAAGAEIEDLAVWNALRVLLLTDADEYRKPRGINIRLGFATKDPMKDRFTALLERLSGDEALRALLAGVRRLPGARFDGVQWEVLGSIVTIITACVHALRDIFARRSAVDHIEVAAAARQALGGELDPTDLSMLLEYRIRHLLVDEFQDTSSNQFLLLRQLTAGWSAPDLHTLFLVGDPMQSIYRFREAEVGLFLQVWEQGRIGSVPLTTLRLTRNFRSQEGIVAWVNGVFSQVMPAASDANAAAVAYAPSVAVHEAESGATEIRVIFSGNRREEARDLASLLRRVLAGEACGPVDSIAVLVRARSHLAELVTELRAEGLRFRAVEIEPLGGSSAVRDLFAITRALLSPADRVAWLAVLRAPFCGMTLADLHALCGDVSETPLRALLRDSARRDKMSAEGRSRADRIAEVLDFAGAMRGRKPLRSLIEGCWTALGAPALLDAAGIDAAMAFLTLLERHDDGGDLDDMGQLERDVNMLFAPPDPEADARLQLMTVHKAKGLQFDVVVIPRMEGTPRREDDRLLQWDRTLGDEGLDFLIAPLKERGAVEEPTYAFIKRMRTMKGEYEDVRLLYVAATRAKRRLYLTATMKESVVKGERSLAPPGKRSFLAYLWPLLEEEIRRRYMDWREQTTPMDGEAESAAGVPRVSMLLRVPADWRPPAPPADAPHEGAAPRRDVAAIVTSESDLVWRAGGGARSAGVVVHMLLERLASEGPAFWTDATLQERRRMTGACFREAGFAVPDHDALDRAESAIERILADERGRWLLGRHDQADCEISLTGIDGENVVSVRIDRTFVDEEGVRWIVDYKTATHEGADLESFLAGQEELYRPQLERYARLMKAWDGRNIRAALYFPLLQRWREVSLASEFSA
jgi:ATP-dependent helicase/nuclease subunit A